jgi:hypothetical protein
MRKHLQGPSRERQRRSIAEVNFISKLLISLASHSALVRDSRKVSDVAVSLKDSTITRGIATLTLLAYLDSLLKNVLDGRE